MNKKIKVTIWNEFYHEQCHEKIKEVYPEGIHRVIANHLELQADFEVATATLDQPEQGLTDEIIARTDVLIWWSHMKDADVSDALVEKLYQRVMAGMGVIFLHSSFGSKLFCRLIGVTSGIKWREAHERERLWVLKPSHPIVDGIGEYFELQQEEMYGEYWDIPEPNEVVLMSWFEGGEIMRSGITYTRGKGKIFYFRPGHEEYPTYYNANVMRIIENATRWTAPLLAAPVITSGNVASLETINGFIRDGQGVAQNAAKSDLKGD